MINEELQNLLSCQTFHKVVGKRCPYIKYRKHLEEWQQNLGVCVKFCGCGLLQFAAAGSA